MLGGKLGEEVTEAFQRASSASVECARSRSPALQTAPVSGRPGRDARPHRRAGRARARAIVPHVQLVMSSPSSTFRRCPPPLEPTDGYAERVAVEVPGPLTDELGAIARDARRLARAGLGLRARRGRRDPQHRPRSLARRASWSPPTARCSPGSRTSPASRATEFVTFDIPDVGRIGLAICYDGSFPETFRQLAWMGAEVVLQPSLTTTSDRAAGARHGARERDLQPALRGLAERGGAGRPRPQPDRRPRGPRPRSRPASGEELLTDVLDLDAVTRVREYGTAGVSRLWDQAERMGPLSPERILAARGSLP